MPTLTWIGKDKVVTHHKDVPYRVLSHQYGYDSANPEDRSETHSGNKIIHGDNLEALKSLLPEYEGRVNCIYIDPPYNTGQENWVYNDNVNDPKIQKWLGEVVGKEGEDLSRHDKWLCMMYPRLCLLKQLLSIDGIILISIDDNEFANLKLLCDDVFGIKNFIELFAWRKTYTPSNLSHTTKKCVEYVLCYAKDKTYVPRFTGLNKTNDADNPLLKSNNQYKELRFPCKSVESTLKGDFYFKAGTYGTKVNTVFLKEDVEFKNGQFLQDIVLEGKFIWTQEMLDSEIAKNTKIIFKGKSFAPRYDRTDYSPEVPRNLIDEEDLVGTTETGGKLLKAIFGRKVFDYPKPPSLIEYLLNFVCKQDAVILDSFAGSGTTAHAVLNLNAHDGGNRKFILIELCDYAETITAERVRRVMSGYSDQSGLGGSFDYYELGERLFNNDGNLNELVSEDQIREYIYFTETKQHLTRPKTEGVYLLDDWNDTSYYFYYQKEAATTLSFDSLRKIVDHKAEQYIIYADICTISDADLEKRHVIFKKIPRDITRF